MGAREPGLSAGETADILGVDAAWVTARIDGGELRGTHHHGSHPSRPMPERHRISEQELRSSSWGTPMGWTAATSTCPDSSVSWRSGTGREAKTRAAMAQRGRTQSRLPTGAGPERSARGSVPWWRPAPSTRRRESSAWTSAGSCAASTGKPSGRSLPTDAAPVCGRLAYTGCRPRPSGVT